MANDKIAGKTKEMLGKGEETLGAALDNPNMEAQGLVRQLEGKAQNAWGSISDGLDCAASCIEDTVRRYPITSVAAVGLAVYLLGRARN